MKKEIKKEMLTLIIGILLGAIIATGVFLVLKSTDSNKNPSFGNRPTFSEGERPTRRSSKNETTEEKEEKNNTNETIEETK